MPYLDVNGARLWVEEHGSGEQAVVFCHGLLFSGRMYEAQVNALKAQYRCITMDFRGQGQSDVTRDGYDIETLYHDAVAVIEALNAAPCHFVGLSMGGFVGQRIAARRPDLLKSVTLIATAADTEPAANVPKYNMLGMITRLFGPGPVMGRVMPIMFGKSTLTDPARAAEVKRWRNAIAGNNRTGIYRALQGVIHRAPVFDELPSITTPTLVLSGEEDVAVVSARSRQMAELIPDAQFITIPKSGHSTSIEQAKVVTDHIASFIAAHP